MESVAERLHFAPEESEGPSLGRPVVEELEERAWRQAEWVSLQGWG